VACLCECAGTGWKGVGCISLAEDRDKWRACVNVQVAYTAENVLTS
jgi:hypothetical protein